MRFFSTLILIESREVMAMTSIRDVAKRAGVSITTVSRSLNNYSDVSEATKQRILDICKDMNYSPNPSAHNLKARNAKNIALLLSDNKKTDANGNIIYRLILGIQEACNEGGYEFCIVFTDRHKQEGKPLIDLYRERSLGGMVIYGLKVTDPYYTQLDNMPIPVATIDMESLNKKSIVVGTDNERAIDDVVSAFYRAGRRQMGMINGDRQSEIGVIRERCFQHALRKYGIPISPDRIRYGDFFEKQAYQETKAMMTEHPEIDALFFASDIMAIGGMNALRELGIRVPERVAVMGFDGIEASGFLRPTLSTIWQDFEGIGHCAAERIIMAIEKKPYDRVNFVPYQIKHRESL
ncbi:MAG: LacI family DNA-binding transcriptional regulator [Raoultibacter sp.]